MKKFFLFFIAAALVCAFAMPAAAMEEKTSEELIESLMEGVGGWRLYGSARMTTFRVDEDVDGDDTKDDKDTQWDLQGNSRLGARVNHGNYGGRFEFAVDDTKGVTTRILMGTYKCANGTLTIGQSYGPVSSYFYSNQVFGGDYDLLNTGALYASRQPMVQFQTGGFKLALIEPGLEDERDGKDVDTTIPKIEASYGFKTDLFFVDLSGGYQTVDVADESWDSLVGAIGVGFNAGPVSVTLGAHYAENGGPYEVWSHKISLWPVVGDDNKVVDNEAMGYLGVVNLKASDMLSFQVGAGFREAELGDAKDDVTTYYGQAVVRLLKNVFIVPEVGVLDIDYDPSKEDKNDEQTIYFGAKWQINW